MKRILRLVGTLAYGIGYLVGSAKWSQLFAVDVRNGLTGEMFQRGLFSPQPPQCWNGLSGYRSKLAEMPCSMTLNSIIALQGIDEDRQHIIDSAWIDLKDGRCRYHF